MSKHPAISILMTTYNRAEKLPVAVDSILKQSFQDFELVLVDNGSTDRTSEVVAEYAELPNIRLFRLDKNRGPRGGYNFAMNQIRGEWFTFLGDDDVLFPNCLERLIEVPKTIDSTINAVTCNVIDSSTGMFAGKGLDKNQYLSLQTIVQKTSGEFFGITKTELLGDLRLNEKLNSHDDAFFYKIDAIAHRYYIHEALRLFNTSTSTESSKLKCANIQHRIDLFGALYEETFYLDTLKKHHPTKYIRKCFAGFLFMKIAQNTIAKEAYYHRLQAMVLSPKNKLLLQFIKSNPSWVLRKLYKILGKNKLRLIVNI